MPLRKARKENRSSPVSQVYCTTSWADVLVTPPSTDIGMSKHLAARPCPHRGLGTFCVPTTHSLLSRDAAERPSDSMLKMADMKIRWTGEPFWSSICNTQAGGRESAGALALRASATPLSFSTELSPGAPWKLLCISVARNQRCSDGAH